jgi:hypothetical protein
MPRQQSPHLGALILLLLFAIPGRAYPQNLAVAVAQAVVGRVDRLSDGQAVRLKKGDRLTENEQILTHQGGVAKVVFFDGTNLILPEGSSVKIGEYYRRGDGNRVTLRSVFKMVRGKARFFIKPQEEPRETVVRTANAILGIRGTTFAVDVHSPTDTTVAVEHGRVVFQGAANSPSVEITAGQVSRVVGADATAETPAPATPEQLATIQEIAATLPEAAQPDAVPATLALPPAPAPIPEKQQTGLKVEMPKTEVEKLQETPPVAPTAAPAPSPTPATTPATKKENSTKNTASKPYRGITWRFLLGPNLFLSVKPKDEKAYIYKDLSKQALSFSLQLASFRFRNGWQAAVQIQAQGFGEPKFAGVPTEERSWNRTSTFISLKGDRPIFSCGSEKQPGCAVRLGMALGGNFLAAQNTDGDAYVRTVGPGAGLELAYESWWNRFLGYTVVLNGHYARFTNFEKTKTITPEQRDFWSGTTPAADLFGAWIYAGLVAGIHF